MPTGHTLLTSARVDYKERAGFAALRTSQRNQENRCAIAGSAWIEGSLFGQSWRMRVRSGSG
jgi:hypothetical protein